MLWLMNMVMKCIGNSLIALIHYFFSICLFSTAVFLRQSSKRWHAPPWLVIVIITTTTIIAVFITTHLLIAFRSHYTIIILTIWLHRSDCLTLALTFNLSLTFSDLVSVGEDPDAKQQQQQRQQHQLNPTTTTSPAKKQLPT